ncbi:hypothetical protein JXA88_02695 [Candidatus Fermentibacteria bacterium]|nr:hypothetical protein [Candidatus Fermentibacteria bacterium]
MRRYFVDVPYWDQWGLVPLIERSYEGTLAFGDLWRQHNEHRLLVPRAVMIALARRTQWRIGWELALSIALAVGVFAVLNQRLARALRTRAAGSLGWLHAILALMLFSMSQWDNWLWGWNLQIMLAVSSVVAGVLLLTASSPSRAACTMSGLLGVVASFSYGAGFAFWPIGMLAIALNRESSSGERRARAAVWFGLSAAVALVYLHGYRETFDSYRMRRLLLSGDPEYWRRFAEYVCCYLGSPLLSYRQAPAFALGVAGAFGFCAFGARSLLRPADRAAQAFALLGFFSVVCAVMSAVGRGRLGAGQALESRYVAISSYLWIANAVVLGKLAIRGGGDAAAAGSWLRRMAVAFLVLMVALLCMNGEMGRRAAQRRSALLESAMRELLGPQDPALLGRLYPNTRLVLQYAEMLRARRLSFYRPGGIADATPAG